MSCINHTLFKLRVSTLKESMIRVSRNIPNGASSPFKTTEYPIVYSLQSQNRNHKSKKNNCMALVNSNNNSCNGPQNLKQQNDQSAFVANKTYHRKSLSNNNNNIRISPPLKEIQSSNIDNSDHSNDEITLFAGSKFYATPSPSDLPKPPENWMNCINSSTSLVLKSDLEKVATTPNSKLQQKVKDMDLKEDSAILVIGKPESRRTSAKKKKIREKARIE